jgi:hypothetical protein
MNEWINVKDRLPNIQMFVLTYDPDFGINPGVMTRRNGSKWLLECYDDVGFDGRVSSYDVTHWMPLPEPPTL